MALIVTPRQLVQRAELYHQLAQLTAAGVGIIQAFEMLHRSPPSRAYRQPLQIVIDGLRSGYTLTEALQGTGRWLPSFDTALLHAGEVSGRAAGGPLQRPCSAGPPGHFQSCLSGCLVSFRLPDFSAH
ncbi:MAG: hypothetical protein DME26_03005 [Verrucomicrobia bacterium]|nr:MAG: hypothetical protein DME26_03005 [Verrucomicrobiota bacterium]